MSREYLENIKSENRLDKIRIIKKNDPVIGGQPNDKEDEFTSNTPILDLACTLKFAVDEIDLNSESANNSFAEIEKALDTKADKSEVETALQLKANKTDVQDALDKKIDKAAITHEKGTAKNKVASQFLISELQKALEQAIKDSTPVGKTSFYIGETAPNDQWLIMRGQKYDTAKYPELYAILKSDTLPDGRGVALRGLDAGRGFDPARTLLSYQEDEFKSHTHRVKYIANLRGEGSGYNSITFTQEPTGTGRIQEAGGTETRMKNLAFNIIIKVK